MQPLNFLVSRLVEIRVLGEMTGHARNRRFRYAPYIELFSDTKHDLGERA